MKPIFNLTKHLWMIQQEDIKNKDIMEIIKKGIKIKEGWMNISMQYKS